MFHTTFRQTCQNMMKMADLLLVSLDEHPILSARHLLNNSYIYAQKPHDFNAIYPCQPVDHYELISSPERCTKRIPLAVSLGVTNRTMWLNPHNNILHDTPSLIDCALNQEIPMVIDGELFFYAHVDGTVRRASGIDKLNTIALDFSDLGKNIGQPVIHKLLLYDWHSFREKFTLNDLTGAMQYQHTYLGI